MTQTGGFYKKMIINIVLKYYMVESTQESLNTDSSIEIEQIIECIFEYIQDKNISGYLT